MMKNEIERIWWLMSCLFQNNSSFQITLLIREFANIFFFSVSCYQSVNGLTFGLNWIPFEIKKKYWNSPSYYQWWYVCQIKQGKMKTLFWWKTIHCLLFKYYEKVIQYIFGCDDSHNNICSQVRLHISNPCFV